MAYSFSFVGAETPARFVRTVSANKLRSRPTSQYRPRSSNTPGKIQMPFENQRILEQVRSRSYNILPGDREIRNINHILGMSASLSRLQRQPKLKVWVEYKSIEKLDYKTLNKNRHQNQLRIKAFSAAYKLKRKRQAQEKKRRSKAFEEKPVKINVG